MKHRLRKQIRDKRQALSSNSHTEKSAHIQNTLLKFKAFQEADDILIYVSKGKEVFTHDLIKQSLKLGKHVYVPKVQGSQLIVCRLHKWEELKPGRFGVLEPVDPDDSAHPMSIDVSIVPGIAFGHNGHRLGYGKGYFDQLLRGMSGTLKIGLCFEEQLVKRVPNEPHDIPLDYIITETSIHNPFNQ